MTDENNWRKFTGRQKTLGINVNVSTQRRLEESINSLSKEIAKAVELSSPLFKTLELPKFVSPPTNTFELPTFRMPVAEMLVLNGRVVKNINVMTSSIASLPFNELSNTVSETVKRISELSSSFKTIDFEKLMAMNNVLDELDFKNSSEDVVLVGGTPTKKVEDMTKEELETIITSAVQAADEEKDSESWFRRFFRNLIGDLGIEVAKWLFLSVIFPILWNIAISNHDFEVREQVSEKINETEQVSMVKKVFVKNPELQQPMGDMAFFRVESSLRTRPSKHSHLTTKEPVPKNTVVTPVEKKGNWILVEVETKEDFYIGWVEESKVIKFTLKAKH